MTSHPPTIESLAAPTIPSGAEPAPRVASSRPVRDTFKELTADYDVAESELHAVPSDGARDVRAQVPTCSIADRFPNRFNPVSSVSTSRNVCARSQISLPPLSLAKFVGWVRNFSTIPITVDPVALQQTGSSMTTSISFEGSELTVGQLLSDVLLPLRLGYFVDDDQLVIVAARTIDHSLRRRYYEVDDLLGGMRPWCDWCCLWKRWRLPPAGSGMVVWASSVGSSSDWLSARPCPLITRS